MLTEFKRLDSVQNEKRLKLDIKSDTKEIRVFEQESLDQELSWQ